MKSYVKFDGSSGYITVNSNSNLNLGSSPFSICWVVPEQKTTPNGGLLELADANPYGLFIYFSSGIMHVELIDGANSYSGTYPTPAISSQTFFVLTRTSTTYKLYVNGDEVALSTSFNTGAVTIPNDNNLVLGNSGYGGGFVNITLDDFRIYTKALSELEAKTIYNKGYGKKYNKNDVGVGFAFNFDEGTGNPVTSGIATLTGTITGGVTWKLGGVPFSHRDLVEEFKKNSFYINMTSECIQFRIGGRVGKFQIREMKLNDPDILDDR